MEIEKKGNELIIRVKLKKNEMWRLSKGKNFRTISIYKKTQECLGYSSKTQDNKHILLLDYDDTYKEVILEDLSHIQRLFSLPPVYLFTTKETKDKQGQIKGNYHCVFLSTHTSREAFKIMGETNIDVNFRDSPIRKASSSWVLRLSEKKGSGKIKFLEIIGNGSLNKEISTAHKKLLSKFFPKIKHPKYLKEDNNKRIKFQIYETKG